jgi:hypothetical protein
MVGSGSEPAWAGIERAYEAERYTGYAELCARMAMGELNELAGVILRALLADKDFSGSAECKPFLGRARACCKWALPYAVTLRLDIQFGGAPPYIPVSKPPDKTEWIPLTAEPRPDWLVVLTTSQEDVNHPDVFDTDGWNLTDGDAPSNCGEPRAGEPAIQTLREWASGTNLSVLPIVEGFLTIETAKSCLSSEYSAEAASAEPWEWEGSGAPSVVQIGFKVIDGVPFACLGVVDCRGL